MHTFTARGFIEPYNDGLVGTFHIDGGTQYLFIGVNLPIRSFTCRNATLTYSSVEQFVDHCTWSGTIGKSNLRMDLGDGVVITGSLDVSRPSSIRVRGVGAWRMAVASSVPANPFANQQENGHVVSTDGVQPALNPFDVSDDPRELEREKRLLVSGAPIIAIIGQSGTGKSTFINLIASEKQKVGKGLHSCTSRSRVIEASIGGHRVVVIDTPGIDDSRAGVKEADVLAGIARTLEAMGMYRVWVTGVLFLHRISDNKFTPTASRISDMLKSLCGKAAMNHLMLCTTMWDQVPEGVANDRLEQLCTMPGAWKEMVDMGASTAAISSVSPTAKADAESLIGELLENARPVKLAIQHEMINQGKSVAETTAGKVLTEHLREAREQAEREMQEIRESMRRENEANKQKARDELLAQEREVERLKRVTEEQAAISQANAERLRQEREKMERDMEEVRKESEANAEKSKEAIRAREVELEAIKRQGEEEARAARELAASLQAERDKAERDMEEARERIRQENEANEAIRQEVAAAHQLEIEELKRQKDKLTEEYEKRAC